jgi:hypothetical protein
VVAHAQGTAEAIEQARRLGIGQFVQDDSQEIRVEKSKRLASLLDSTERVFFGLGKVLEESPDVGEHKLAGVALSVKEDEAARPVHVALGGFRPAKMGKGGPIALVEEARRLRWSVVVGRGRSRSEGHERTSM